MQVSTIFLVATTMAATQQSGLTQMEINTETFQCH